MPLLISFARTSATVTALTIASFRTRSSGPAPASFCIRARTADASNTGLPLSLMGCLRPVVRDDFLGKPDSRRDILPHQRPRAAQALLARFDHQAAVLIDCDAQLGRRLNLLLLAP